MNFRYKCILFLNKFLFSIKALGHDLRVDTQNFKSFYYLFIVPYCLFIHLLNTMVREMDVQNNWVYFLYCNVDAMYM